jgi:putative ABC transport system permease protein
VLARPRLYAALVGYFALVSLLLAAIGVYGLVAHVVTQRTHEIGIRLALGATRRRVFFDVFSSGARLVAVGVVLGVAAALGLSRILSVLVFGVSARDPVTYLVAVLTLSGVAVAAVVIPARRAARLESMTAFRCD